MINRFFRKDKSFQVVAKMMSVEPVTLIEDMKLLIKFLLKPESITPIRLNEEVIIEEVIIKEALTSAANGS